MKNDFEMTPEQLDDLKKSSKPTPVMLIGGVDTGRSAQANANDAWERLGKTMGFDHMTVSPNGKGERFFSAETVA